jgi:hypothetical protein
MIANLIGSQWRVPPDQPRATGERVDEMSSKPSKSISVDETF